MAKEELEKEQETLNTESKTEDGVVQDSSVNDYSENFEYSVDMSDYIVPEEDPVELDPELQVKDWDDSKYLTDPKESDRVFSIQPLATGTSSNAVPTYRKLKDGSLIASSGIAIDSATGKTLDAYIKGNAFYINGTKVLWYEE